MKLWDWSACSRSSPTSLVSSPHPAFCHRESLGTRLVPTNVLHFPSTFCWKEGWLLKLNLLLANEYSLLYSSSQNVVLTNNSAALPNFINSSAPLYKYYYFFNITNPDEVQQHNATPVLTEVGPFVYMWAPKCTFICRPTSLPCARAHAYKNGRLE